METIKIIEESVEGTTIDNMSPLIREQYFINLAKVNKLGLASAYTLDELYQKNNDMIVLQELPKMKELTLRKVVRLSSLLGIEVTAHLDMAKTPSHDSIKVKFDIPVRVARMRKYSVEAADTELIVSSITMRKITPIPVNDIIFTVANDDLMRYINYQHKISTYCNESKNILTNIDTLLRMIIELITFQWSSIINIIKHIHVASSDGILNYAAGEFDWLYTSDSFIKSITGKPREYKYIDEQIDKNRDLLSAINSAAGLAIPIYYDACIQQLILSGLDRIYYDVKHGRAADIESVLASYQTIRAYHKHRHNIKMKITNEINLAQIYLRIIEQRLPSKYQRVAHLNLPSPILAALSDSERKLILIEYEQRVKYIEAQVNNKCEHVQALRKFRRSTTTGYIASAYNELRKYFDKQPQVIGGAKHIKHEDDGFIHCNICRYPIICSHVDIFTSMTIEGAGYVEIKSALNKYISSNREYDTDPYCKICGTIISSDVLEAIDTPDIIMDDELKKFIYGEIMGLLRYINFGTLVNVQQTVSMLRDACYPYVADIEKRIMKSKTASADEIKSKLRLYTAIHIIAYFVHLSIKNPKIVNIKGVPSDKNPVVGYIKRAIEIILESKNTVIRFIPNINTDVIKNAIINSYKIITTVKIATVGEITHIPIDYDPIYRYIEMMSTHKSVRKPKSIDEIRKISDPIELLDIDIKKKLSIYKNVKYSDAGKQPLIPNQWSSDWSSLHKWIIDRSYECLIRYIHTGIYNEPVYINTGVDGNVEFTLNPDIQSWYDTIKPLSDANDAYRRSVLIRASPSYHVVKTSERLYKYDDIPVSHIYDDTGKLHKWDIFVIDGKDIPKKQVTAGAALSDIDYKCSICGILKSEVNTIDVSIVTESLNMLSSEDNFYRFYDTRCPEGSLHEMVNNVCTKCNYDHKPSSKYFKKYSKQYDIERKSLHKVNVEDVIEYTPSADFSAEYKEWSFNFNSLLYIADTFKVNQKALSALGATNNVDYDLIINGTYIPPEADSPDDTRIYTLCSHVLGFVREYNQLRNFGRTLKPYAHIIQFVETHVPKHLINKLPDLLQPIEDTFKQRFDWFRLNKKPRETVLWVLQWLCDTMSHVAGTGSTETEKVRHAFVQMYVNKLITNDMMVSKPKHFNWALIYGEKEEKSRDRNYIIDEESDEDEEEPGAMSMDAFDMEDADEDNQIDVESYGLD